MSNLEDLGIEINTDEVMNYGEQNLGLADFMEVDVSDIEANEGGFDILPVGVYKFSVEKISVSTVNRKSKETGEDLKIPQISVSCNVDEVIELLPQEDGREIDESKVVGRKHFHNVTLPSYDGEAYVKAFGRLKAFAQKLSPEANLSSVKSVLEAIAGKEFVAKIAHRKYQTKDDADGEKSGRSAEINLKSIKVA